MTNDSAVMGSWALRTAHWSRGSERTLRRLVAGLGRATTEGNRHDLLLRMEVSVRHSAWHRLSALWEQIQQQDSLR